jgi:hypothetical protein
MIGPFDHIRTMHRPFNAPAAGSAQRLSHAKPSLLRAIGPVAQLLALALIPPRLQKTQGSLAQLREA